MTNCSKIIFTLLLISSAFTSRSQILNIDRTDTTSYIKKAAWTAQAGLGLELDKRKTALWDISNALDVSLQKNHELYIFSASQRLTYQTPSYQLNTGFFHLRWRHNFKSRLHGESLAQYQWD